MSHRKIISLVILTFAMLGTVSAQSVIYVIVDSGAQTASFGSGSYAITTADNGKGAGVMTWAEGSESDMGGFDFTTASMSFSPSATFDEDPTMRAGNRTIQFQLTTTGSYTMTLATIDVSYTGIPVGGQTDLEAMAIANVHLVATVGTAPDIVVVTPADYAALTAVPEPSTAAAILGFLSLGLVAARRRTREAR